MQRNSNVCLCQLCQTYNLLSCSLIARKVTEDSLTLIDGPGIVLCHNPDSLIKSLTAYKNTSSDGIVMHDVHIRNLITKTFTKLPPILLYQNRAGHQFTLESPTS